MNRGIFEARRVGRPTVDSSPDYSSFSLTCDSSWKHFFTEEVDPWPCAAVYLRFFSLSYILEVDRAPPRRERFGQAERMTLSLVDDDQNVLM